ncbi:MAG: dUTP diphosphatase [Pseudomonadota bacterium]
MIVQFRKILPTAILPRYAHAGDAGMDVFAYYSETIEPGETIRMTTGLEIALPEGYFGSARERSGLAAMGIRLGGGVIDAGYRGEILGILTNLSRRAYTIERGDRIFQIIIQPFATAEILEADELPAGERGQAGLGSTGR